LRPFALLQRVIAARGKLVLVGDHLQLPELQAGGVFRGLVHRGLTVELHENVRQSQTWERETLDELRIGDAERAMEQFGR
jgi:ATP-dependent exoDNAse (exonuclease V) alpha subunit